MILMNINLNKLSRFLIWSLRKLILKLEATVLVHWIDWVIDFYNIIHWSLLLFCFIKQILRRYQLFACIIHRYFLAFLDKTIFIVLDFCQLSLSSFSIMWSSWYCRRFRYSLTLHILAILSITLVTFVEGYWTLEWLFVLAILFHYWLAEFICLFGIKLSIKFWMIIRCSWAFSTIFICSWCLR